MTRTVAVISVAALAVVWAQPAEAQRDVLMLRGPGSSIGLQINDLDATANAPSDGVRVTTVRENTPAARAGFQPGDVVVEFDGERVRSARQFQRVVEETRPNREVKAVVLRNGDRRTLSVTPELASAAPQLPNLPDFPNLRVQPGRRGAPGAPLSPNTTPRQPFNLSPAAPRLGVSVSDLTDQLRDYFGVKQGVLVSSVESGTPAERAGVKAGDVIVDVAGQPVSSASDVTSALGKARDGAIELHIVREKKDLRLKATIPAAAQPGVRSNRNGERL